MSRVGTLLSSLRSNRRLLKEFVIRDLKARYVGSSMGFFWSVVFPIINLFVYMFVFRIVLKTRWSDHQGSLEVALIMLGGIVVWSAFSETIARSTSSLVENSNLIQKVVFPSELLPVFLTISSIINMCIGLPVVLICVLWFLFVQPPTVGFGWHEARITEHRPQAVLEISLTRGQDHPVSFDYFVSMKGADGDLEEMYRESCEIPVGCIRTYVDLLEHLDAPADDVESIFLSIDKVVGAGLRDHTTCELKRAWDKTDPAYEAYLLDPAQSPEPRTVSWPKLGVETLVEQRELHTLGLGPIDETYQPLSIGVGLIALPVLLLLQFILTAGLGFFLATINLFLRDTTHLVGVFITVWMFGTPIFYSADMVRNAGYGWVLYFNPMHWIIEGYRSVLLYGTFPDWISLGCVGVAACVIFALGGSFFMAQRHRFPDLL